MNFWKKLPKPIMVLAPMADVTDAAFRRMIAKYSKWGGVLPEERSWIARPFSKKMGGPDVMWTEFVSADGLVRADAEGQKKLRADLVYSEAERPIVAQIFSAVPEHIEAAARLARELGFDGVDINMGCPDRSIEKQGCGAAMIKNPDAARAVIRAAKRGAGVLPVSVKTRLGYNHDTLEEWLPELLAEEPAAITIHARTRKEMSKVPARWERIARAVEIRDEAGSETLILGNGDVTDVPDGRRKAELFGADGVMLGRAIFGNPWLFNSSKHLFERIPLSAASPPLHRTASYGSHGDSLLSRSASQKGALSTNNEDALEIVSIEERLRVMVEHTRLFEELLGTYKSFSVMKKHYKAYVHGFDGAKELRSELMETNSAEEVAHIVERFLMAGR